MLSAKTFRYEVRDHIATITLDRPDTLNSLTFAVYRELTDLFRALRDERMSARSSSRALVVAFVPVGASMRSLVRCCR